VLFGSIALGLLRNGELSSAAAMGVGFGVPIAISTILWLVWFCFAYSADESCCLDSLCFDGEIACFEPRDNW
jgi:hypothetical protein